MKYGMLSLISSGGRRLPSRQPTARRPSLRTRMSLLPAWTCLSSASACSLRGFSDGCVWGAWRGPRVVVPQLALEP